MTFSSIPLFRLLLFFFCPDLCGSRNVEFPFAQNARVPFFVAFFFSKRLNNIVRFGREMHKTMHIHSHNQLPIHNDVCMPIRCVLFKCIKFLIGKCSPHILRRIFHFGHCSQKSQREKTLLQKMQTKNVCATITSVMKNCRQVSEGIHLNTRKFKCIKLNSPSDSISPVHC